MIYIQQRKVFFFGKRFLWSDNTVLLTLSRLKYNAFIAAWLYFRCGVLTPKLSDNAVKGLVWNSFAASVEL